MAGPVPRLSAPRLVPVVPRGSPSPTPRSSYASVPATPAPSAPASRAASPPPQLAATASYDSLAHLILDAPPAYTRREAPAPSYTPPAPTRPPSRAGDSKALRSFRSGVASVGEAIARGGSRSGNELFASSVRAERR
ncbi:hypothetical protein Q8F55_001584 [Vanrija albida]|uniref:Uncharacterized protein n=1 Tax=Vanrija albida TaxID=181172 RepID=A0ABR3QGE4_9TREE